MLDQSQLIADFTVPNHPRFCRYIFSVISSTMADAIFSCEGDWSQVIKRIGNEVNHRQCPGHADLSFHMSGMIADHRRNLGQSGIKID